MDNMKHRRLQELDRSDFEITKGEPDIRGWDVRNADGQKIGEVEDLIIDAQQKKVRYMVVELEDDDVDLDDDKKVLIPIGLAELHKDEDDVLLPAVTVEQLKGLPAYDRDQLDEEVERRICNALGRTAEEGTTTYRAGGTGSQSESFAASTDTTIDNNRQRNDSPAQSSGTAMEARNEDKQTNDSTSQANSQQPNLGTAEYYGNFYQHTFFNDENLYRNRMQEDRSTDRKKESDYERGLRLWEMRSEGGIIPGESNPDSGPNNEMSDERRMEIVRNRRKIYEENRGHKKDKTIIQRIKDEGMQDAGR